MSWLGLALTMNNGILLRDKRIDFVVLSLGRRDEGMTLIEVLMSILLFAIFMGNFLIVTEILGQWIPSGPSVAGSAGASSCDSQQLESACVNVAFDSIVPSLQSYYDKKDPDKFVPIVGKYRSPSELPLGESTPIGMDWPESYEIEISEFPGLAERPASGSLPLTSSAPGLYLIVASPDPPAYWRRPVFRLFCRPYHRCIKP